MLDQKSEVWPHSSMVERWGGIVLVELCSWRQERDKAKDDAGTGVAPRRALLLPRDLGSTPCGARILEGPQGQK